MKTLMFLIFVAPIALAVLCMGWIGYFLIRGATYGYENN